MALQTVEPGAGIDELREQAEALLKETGLEGVDRDGAWSLFCDAIVVDADLSDYVNGQHLSMAMIDQGVHEVLLETSIGHHQDPPSGTIFMGS